MNFTYMNWNAPINNSISSGTDFATGMFTNFSILGQNWIIGLVLVFLTCVLITRNVEKWKTIFFYATLGWAGVGITIHPAIITISALIFALEIVSIEKIGNMIQAVAKATKPIYESTGTMLENVGKKAILEKRKENIKKQVVYDATKKAIEKTTTKGTELQNKIALKQLLKERKQTKKLIEKLNKQKIKKEFPTMNIEQIERWKRRNKK